jgi:hypothetical protein
MRISCRITVLGWFMAIGLGQWSDSLINADIKVR